MLWSHGGSQRLNHVRLYVKLESSSASALQLNFNSLTSGSRFTVRTPLGVSDNYIT
jgi:hypothetical protein